MPKSFHLSLVLKGVLIAAITALILALIFSLLLSFTKIPESNLALNLILALSVFWASALVAYQAGTRGLYYGLATGFSFIIFLLLVSAIFLSNSPSWLEIGEKTIFALFAGASGGIVGMLIKR